MVFCSQLINTKPSLVAQTNMAWSPIQALINSPTATSACKVTVLELAYKICFVLKDAGLDI